MTNTCRAPHCQRTTDLYLCQDDINALAMMLDEIPWLIEELDARIQKLDRISLGTIGRNRRPDELNVMDFDAAETAREVRKLLLKWVKDIGVRALGRPPSAISTATTPDLARWLRANVNHIARDKQAGKLYSDINRLVGTSQKGGQLVTAINPTEQHAAGPCPTIVGKNRDGSPRQCGEMLFADTYDRTTTCPKCGQDIDVEKNRIRANAERDLHTKPDIVEVLTNIDEPVTTEQLELWIVARRLRPRGYLHDGAIVEFRITDKDEPVYSVERARKLRRRDHHLTRRRKAHA